MATIRELRDQAGLTPTEIEQRTEGKVKKGALNAIERGQVKSPRYDLVAALAAALGVPAHACHTAIAASYEANRTGNLPRRGVGRPPAPASDPPTLAQVTSKARELTALLEELTTSGGR